MKKLRFVLGTNDGVNVFDGHMGEADFFYIYEIFEDGPCIEGFYDSGTVSNTHTSNGAGIVFQVRKDIYTSTGNDLNWFDWGGTYISDLMNLLKLQWGWIFMNNTILF